MILNPVISPMSVPNFSVPSQAKILNNDSRITQEGAMSGNEFLSELKSSFKAVNIITGNITPDNSQNFAFSGSGLHNIAVSDKYLDEMASTPEKRLEFVKKINEIVSLDKQYKTASEQNGGKLVSHGVVIDSEGGMRGWSHSTMSSENNGNSMNKIVTEKKKSISETMKELREKRKEKAAAKEELEKKREEKLEKKKKQAEKTEQRHIELSESLEVKEFPNMTKVNLVV